MGDLGICEAWSLLFDSVFEAYEAYNPVESIFVDSF